MALVMLCDDCGEIIGRYTLIPYKGPGLKRKKGTRKVCCSCMEKTTKKKGKKP